jgi:putative acetyltransferase
MDIRQTTQADLQDVLSVERAAFNRDVEADITLALLSDHSAEPRLSLMAYVDAQPVGHILFTKATLVNHPEIAVSFLAPLAVIPKFQRQGIGTTLIKKSTELLTKANVDLIVVVGHPTYYPKFGFKPASELGFEPTYPIPAEVADAWMVKALKPDTIGRVSGRVVCCDAMNKREIWRQ